MTDALRESLDDLLDGSYDCVDRIVLNAYNPWCASPGGFREFWRRLDGSDEHLDNAHLMRMAGRFSRRVRGAAKARGIPVIDCRRKEKKYQLAEDYLARHTVNRGVFLILVARAVAPIWEVARSARGVIHHLTKKLAYVNYYSFHIMDPEWGHIVIKMASHPPFGAQIILNGHEYVARQAFKAHMAFRKEGNCFTHLNHPADLALVADTLSDPETVGRLSQVADQWIYSACLCFALGFAEQERTSFTYQYSVYQLEYSRNLLFQAGSQMEEVFQKLVDRTRARLHVPELRTLFGTRARPRATPKQPSPTLAVAVEITSYDRTLFKVQFGKLDVKAYTKGERVLRFEAVVHNTNALNCGRRLLRFPLLVARLKAMIERFLTMLDCVDRAFVSDSTLDQLPLPSRVGKTRVGGVDPNKPRMRAALTAAVALAAVPDGFTVTDFATRVRALTGQPPASYGVRQAAYDLKKLRGKQLVVRCAGSHHYSASPEGLRAMTALVVLRDHVISPLLAGVRTPRMGRKPATWTRIDRHYETLRLDMRALFRDLGVAA
jgi:hypothetical protein